MATLRFRVRLTPASTSSTTPLENPPEIRVNPSSFNWRRCSCTSVGSSAGRAVLERNKLIDTDSVYGKSIVLEKRAGHRHLQVSCRFMLLGAARNLHESAQLVE